MVAERAAPAEGAHVLIVDDDPRIRAMLARYLKGEGFRVGEAGDGAAMRACLARDMPDLVLLDLVKGRDWAAHDRSVDQQVARLRRKVEPDPGNPSLIKSVRGVGYLFAAEVRRG